MITPALLPWFVVTQFPLAEDVFPCKDCGIWYRSERNLQAHLMYYCASRQNSSSPSVDEKPKEAYPNERVCPFPQCKKSCPSASSLEIHMRSHSGKGTPWQGRWELQSRLGGRLARGPVRLWKAFSLRIVAGRIKAQVCGP